MIDVRTAFPEAHEKNRRTGRGHKPTRYVANAPKLRSLVEKIYPNILFFHESSYRGLKHHWYLVKVAALYGYVHLREHDRSPFEVNCLTMATLQSMVRDIETATSWHASIPELVKNVAKPIAPGTTKNGTNFGFIEGVKNKFTEHFEPVVEPKPIKSYTPYYTFGSKDKTGIPAWDWGYDDDPYNRF